MRVFTPVEIANHAANKYLGVLVAAKYARVLNEFPRDRSSSREKKLTTRSLEELAKGDIEYHVVPAPAHGLIRSRSLDPARTPVRRILLGVTGGIASYKSAWLARLLTKAGAEVDVVMTRAATEFVGAVTFEALTGRPVHTGLFDPGRALDHIKLARERDGDRRRAGDGGLSRARRDRPGRRSADGVLLAATCPVLLVPAMNDHMWAHPQTQRNVAHLRELGYRIVDPDEGDARGRRGKRSGTHARAGNDLRARRTPARSATRVLAGKRVLVTAGPTREAIDPVRFISNHSSGKMGVAIAAAAWRRGARRRARRRTAERRGAAGRRRVHAVRVDGRDGERRSSDCCRESDVLVMAAAPADFRPADAGDVEDQEDRRARRRSRSRRRPTFSQSTQGARRNGRGRSSASRSRRTTRSRAGARSSTRRIST